MEQKLTKAEIQARNQEFLNLQEQYLKSNKEDKSAFDEMWNIIYECAYNTLKKKAGGYRNDLEELAEDATLILMDRIKNGTKRNKEWKAEYLPTCVHFIVLKLLYNEQQKFEDRLISWEEYKETHAESEENELIYSPFEYDY